MKADRFDHEFVEFIPSTLAEGVLFISTTYATAVHLCACGCGNKVVTPLSPAEWQLTFDGDSVSLHPSIGNWQFPCRSHYFIRNGRVRWARPWTDEEIAQGRQRDLADVDAYFQHRQDLSDDFSIPPNEPAEQATHESFLRRLFRRKAC